MKLLVVGASQGTGALCVKLALERGHDVTAFSRNPQKLGIEHPRLRFLPGDFLSKSDINAAVSGHDGVIVTASLSSPKEFKAKPNFFSDGTRLVIEGMEQHGVKRLVVLSALGAGESAKVFPFFVRIIVGFLFKAAMEDHARQETVVRASPLEWVIARPGQLKDVAGSGHYVAKPEFEPVANWISRADLARFLVDAADSDQFVRRAMHVGA